MSTPGFQQTRLREAREARGLTATSLSELVGVSPGAISQYENGHHTPSFEVLKRIADTLKVEPALFFMPPRPDDDRVIFWRSRQAATALQRARSLRKHDWMLDVVFFLSRYIEFPPVSFPDYAPPREVTRVCPEEIEEVALAVRSQWTLGEGPICNLVQALENGGAVVVRTAMDAEHLDAFSEWAGRPCITLGSDKDSEARSLFDGAHELGHMVLHRGVKSNDFNKASVHALLERQANRFAGALLLPEASFTSDLYAISLDAFRDLKTRWRVSISAMIRRAADLGLISERQQKNLWIGMARRKWRSCEPGDAESVPEHPVLLHQAFDMLLESGVLDPRAMEIELGLSIHDIEAVVGLPTGYLENDRRAPLKFRLTR